MGTESIKTTLYWYGQLVVDYDKFNDFAKENKDRFNILSTNIQSINSKFSELEVFLEYLDSINFKFNVICMQETWKAEGDDFSQFMLQGYNCITQGKSSSTKGGLVIYIDDKYKADVISNLNSYEHWEGLIIKVNGGNLSKTLTTVEPLYNGHPWDWAKVTLLAG